MQKNEPESDIFGIVVFYVVKDGQLIELSRTPVLDYWEALEMYAEVAIPASQLLTFRDLNEKHRAEAELENNIRNPLWVQELINCL